MAVFRAHSEIQRHDSIEIGCFECGLVSLVPRPDSVACDALIEIARRAKFQTEMSRLNRMSGIFDKFPRANHRFIEKTGYRECIVGEDHLASEDILLQQQLDDDLDLSRFLESSDFSYASRRSYVESQIADFGQLSSARHILCVNCGAPMGWPAYCG